MTLSLPIVWHDSLDSTNEEAKRLAASSSFTQQWVAARRQTAGRGRLGRDWASPQGNLFATALFDVPGGIIQALRLPFAAALAVHDTVSAYGVGAGLALKWPNDVRHQGAKISGILVESGTHKDRLWVAVGIGINLANAPEGVQQEATCLADLYQGPMPSPEVVLEALADAFARRVEQAWSDFENTRSDWCARAEGRDGLVRANVGDEQVEGRFAGLAQDGGLIIDLPGGGQRTIRAGDVELVKQV